MPLYLILDLAAVVIPVAFSFDKRLNFYKLYRSLTPSIIIVGFVFVVWDSFFTRMGVWGFNPDYLTGIYILNLPLEEYLFFICVPYAGIFTFHVFKTLLSKFVISEKQLGVIILLPATLLLIAGLYFYDKWYTCVTFIFSSLTLLLAWLVFRKNLSHFILSYLAILIPFFIMNGILTGTFIDGEVVWYNNEENLGVRIFTIPLEDIFYGLTLLLWNVNLTTLFERKPLKK